MPKVLVAGASGNVGQACLNVFRTYHWDVLGVCRHPSNQPQIRLLDLTQWAEVREFVKQEGPFDLVIACQGVQVPCELKDLTLSLAKYILDNNLLSTLILSSALVSEKGLTDGALVVMFSSIQAFAPRRGRGVYACAKGGIEALSKALAVELAPSGRCVALRLGQLDKTMRGVSFTPQELSYLRSRTLLSLPAVEDVAKLIYNLYYQPALTGCVIDLSSGHTLNVW